jgi:hypothetical protein
MTHRQGCLRQRIRKVYAYLELYYQLIPPPHEIPFAMVDVEFVSWWRKLRRFAKYLYPLSLTHRYISVTL